MKRRSNPNAVYIDAAKFQMALIEKCGSINNAIRMSYAPACSFHTDIKNGWFPACRTANLKMIFTDEEIESFTIPNPYKESNDDGSYVTLIKLVEITVAKTVKELINEGVLPNPAKESDVSDDFSERSVS